MALSAAGPDWAAFRAGFPALAGDAVHASTAGGGPVSSRAAAAARRYFDEAEAEGDAPWGRWLERVDGVRAEAAALIGAEAGDVAFLGSASVALNAAAALLAPGDRVVTVDGEFPSVTLPFVARGCRVEAAPLGPRGAPDLEALAETLSRGAAAVAVSHVQFRTGRRLDLAALGRMARAAGALLIVDATQSLGAQRIDAPGWGISVLAASHYKWLCAGYGAGTAYLAPELRRRPSPVMGWRSAEEPYALEPFAARPAATAVRLEMGHPPFAPIFALGGALAHLAKTVGGGEGPEAAARGVAAVEARILTLGEALRARLAALDGPQPLAAAEEGGIAVFPSADPAGTKARLSAAGVSASASAGHVRLSLHAFLREDEAARAGEALVAALA